MNPQHADLYHEDNPPSLNDMGLLGEPFADSAAGHFFFADADGAQRLDLLLHLAPYSPLLVIMGKPGVGKTALLRQFAARASDTWRVAVVTARVDMGREELLRDMIRGFGLLLDHRADYRELYDTLVTHLKALRQNAQAPILLLDDAQYLSATMMELILKLNSENDNGHMLSILLFGTPQLQSLLDSPALASLAARVAHTFEVTPFGEEETGAYIRHRLRAAGAADDGPFDAMLINKIYAASGGVPARINELAQQMLIDKTLGGKERKAGRGGAGGPGSTKRLVLIAAALVMVLMVVGPLRTTLFKSNPNPPMPAAPQQSRALELAPPLIVGEKERVKRPASPESTPAEAPAPVPAPEAATPSTEAMESLPLPPLAPAAEVPAEVTQPVTATAAPESAPVPVPAKPSAQAPAKPPAQVESAKPPVVKPLAAKEKPAVAPAPGGGIHGKAWVNEQPAGHYTLQLMALNEEATARQFIEMQHVQDKAAYFPVHRDGKILYVVVYGVYPDHGAAARAAKQLPAKWGTPNPWVRSFKNLQGEFGK